MACEARDCLRLEPKSAQVNYARVVQAQEARGGAGGWPPGSRGAPWGCREEDPRGGPIPQNSV